MLKWLHPALFAACALALTGCTTETVRPAEPTATSVPTTFTVWGEVHVALNESLDESLARTDRFISTGDNSCTAPPGLEDVRAGAQIEVTDPRGELLGFADLTEGEYESDSCIFTFSVQDLPAGEKGYAIHIGNTLRGEVWFTERQMRQGPVLAI